MSKKLPKREQLEAERIAEELWKVHQTVPLTLKEAKRLAIASKLFQATLEPDPIFYPYQKHDTIENTDDTKQRDTAKPRLPVLEF